MDEDAKFGSDREEQVELDPFVEALLNGDEAAIRSFAADGRDVNAVLTVDLFGDGSDEEITPLMLAAGSDRGADAETLRLLLELGADPRQQLDELSAIFPACIGLGWDPETGAIRGGDAARLGVLLDAGCPLPQDLEDANRLLCKTAATGDPERLGMLLERGLSPKPYFDPDKEETEYRELNRRSREIRERDTREAGEESEAWVAEAKAEMDRMEEEDIARLRSAPSSSDIPLFRAAESGSAECVKLLLDAGADLEQRDDERQSALFHTASTEVARLLIEAGLSLEYRDCWDHTPLMSALGSLENPLRRVRALLAAGADPNATSDHGFTLFMSAVRSESRSVELLRMLVEHGSDPHAVSDYGYNAFHAAIDVSFVGDDIENVMPIMSYIKELGVDIEHRNKNGQTPLAHAIENGFGAEAAALCELGADPNAICPLRHWSGGKWTRIEKPMLIHAVKGSCMGRVEKVESLLRAGADPSATDGDGYPAISIAASEVASDAGDEEYEAAGRAFFQAIKDIRVPPDAPKDRVDYVAAVSPAIRQAVERWAEGIPRPKPPGWRQQLTKEYPDLPDEREEDISVIVALIAHDAWRKLHGSGEG